MNVWWTVSVAGKSDWFWFSFNFFSHPFFLIFGSISCRFLTLAQYSLCTAAVISSHSLQEETSARLWWGICFSLLELFPTRNLTSYNGKSKQIFISLLADENWKAHCQKRGKTWVTKVRVVFVLLWLIERTAQVFVSPIKEWSEAKIKHWIVDYCSSSSCRRSTNWEFSNFPRYHASLTLHLPRSDSLFSPAASTHSLVNWLWEFGVRSR